ncbi:hypothetical protein KR222_000014, partial [Zaprionus bogoriensis]
IQKCNFGHSECIMKSINDLIRRYPKGIPEIGLPPLGETNLFDVSILHSPSRGPIWLNFHMKNIVNKGFDNATITSVEGFDRDPTRSKIVVKAHIPSVTHEGVYDMQGRVLLFEANTTGSLQSDFQNFRLTLTFKVIVDYRNNKRYLRIYDLVPVVDVDRWIILLNDLYKENTDLTLALNHAFNKNWVEFWNDFEPGLLKAFTLAFTGMLNKVFEIVAYDDMFLPGWKSS